MFPNGKKIKDQHPCAEKADLSTSEPVNSSFQQTEQLQEKYDIYIKLQVIDDDQDTLQSTLMEVRPNPDIFKMVETNRWRYRPKSSSERSKEFRNRKKFSDDIEIRQNYLENERKRHKEYRQRLINAKIKKGSNNNISKSKKLLVNPNFLQKNVDSSKVNFKDFTESKKLWGQKSKQRKSDDNDNIDFKNDYKESEKQRHQAYRQRKKAMKDSQNNLRSTEKLPHKAYRQRKKLNKGSENNFKESKITNDKNCNDDFQNNSKKAEKIRHQVYRLRKKINKDNRSSKNDSRQLKNLRHQALKQQKNDENNSTNSQSNFKEIKEITPLRVKEKIIETYNDHVEKEFETCKKV